MPLFLPSAPETLMPILPMRQGSVQGSRAAACHLERICGCRKAAARSESRPNDGHLQIASPGQIGQAREVGEIAAPTHDLAAPPREPRLSAALRPDRALPRPRHRLFADAPALDADARALAHGADGR